MGQGCLGPAALVAIIIGLGAAGIFITQSPKPINQPPSNSVQPTIADPNANNPPEETSLKQGTFTFERPTGVASQAPSICTGSNLVFDDEGSSNRNSNIFIALDPPNGRPIGASGEIRAWASDEAGGRFPSSATADANGNIIRHSNPAVDKDSHGYPWEPAIYLTQITSANVNGPYAGDKESGGAPTLPNVVKGKATAQRDSAWLNIPMHDDPLPFRIGTRVGDGRHVAQFNWNVRSLNLTPGTYRVQVALHDGDSHLAIECTTITI